MLSKSGLLDEASTTLQQARVLYQVAAQTGMSPNKVKWGNLRCDWLAASLMLKRGIFADAVLAVREVIAGANAAAFHQIKIYAACTLVQGLRLLGRHAELDEVLTWALPLARQKHLHYRHALLAYEAATSLRERGNVAEAMRFLHTADRLSRATGGTLLQADILTFRANLAAARSLVNRALKLHQQARRTYQRVGFNSGVALCWLNMGHLFLSRGNYPQALHSGQNAETLARQHGDGRVTRLAQQLLGATYRWVGNVQHASQYLRQTLSAFEQAQDWTMATFAAGELAHLLSDPTERAHAMQHALDLARRCETSLNSATAMCILAELCLKEGDFALATSLAQSSATHLHRSDAALYANVADLIVIEAGLQAAQHDPDQLENALHALDSLAADARHLPEFASRVAYARSLALTQLGQRNHALAAALEAARHEARVRATAPDPILATHLAATKHPQYAFGLQLAFESEAIDTALRLACLRRTSWYTRGAIDISTSEDGAAQKEVEELIAHIRRLRRSIGDTALNASADAAGGANSSELHSAYARLDQILAAQRSLGLDPSSPTREAGVNVLRVALTQRHGRAWTLIVIEPLADQKTWLLIRLTPDEWRMRSLQVDFITRRALQICTTPDQRSPEAIYAAAATPHSALAQLAAWLGIDDWLPTQDSTQPEPSRHRLIIADCEPFTRLGFGALPTAHGPLAQQAILSFCPSLKIARPRKVRPESAPLQAPFPKALFVAAEAGQTKHMLPAVEKEVTACAALWPAAQILRGEAAHMAHVRRYIEHDQPTLIHFAAHVRFDPQMPRLSSLILNDGPITATQICRYRTQAELVCMAGCESSRHWQLGGEERLGVETAWLAAGAERVLSTPWFVPDTQTQDFMIAFHQHYAQSHDAALALHHATQQPNIHKSAYWSGWRIQDAVIS